MPSASAWRSSTSSGGGSGAGRRPDTASSSSPTGPARTPTSGSPRSSARPTASTSPRPTSRPAFTHLLGHEDVVVELELRRQVAPLEELSVAQVRRKPAPWTGHRLEPDQRLPDGEQVVPPVEPGGDDRGRRPLADADVAAVEQRVVDQTGPDVVGLDAVVPD